MGIGSYRHLVTLEHPVVELDPPTWACSLQPAAQVADGLAAFFVRGRFHPGIGLETQFVFEGRTFQVQSVHDLDERHREIQVTAVEVVGRGTTPGGAPVFVPPTITVGPVGATIDAGESVMLTVIAVGAVPLFYQWTADGVDLPGAIYQFLETGPLTATTAYAVRVSNTYGSVLSAPAIVTVVVAYQDVVIADGASAYWPLDDPSGTIARDLMGERDATISGGVTLNQPGVTAATKAVVFPADGLGRIIPPSLPSLGSAFTLEVWIQPSIESAGSQRFVLCRLITTDGDFEWSVPTFTTTLRFRYFSGSYIEYDTAVPLTVGAWSHWVITGGSGQLTLYVNGVAQPPATHAVAGAGGAGLKGIGCEPEAGAETWGWRGAMQDVAIYPRALSPAEILAHYALRLA